ncbi:A/G-specific adenine glycosylase [Mailhella sp.]|uniref:A/G-specific adenine glycosylase n=1 Tax=Mailhella sp. TaxID=1981029 RepID=UPI00406295E7
MMPALPYTFSDDEACRAAAALLDWFRVNRRPLPWRERYTAYEVWISEVMLQQTQMTRGVAYFQRWMARFPDAAAVAEAPEEEILRYWEGLGYYRRARFLHQAAKAIVERHRGIVPSDPDALAALPGLGAYTASAIRAIAFEHDVVPVDANVERVFSRLLDIAVPIKKKAAADLVKSESLRLLPPGQARDYAQALMELGALVCGKVPKCAGCPLRNWCKAHSLGVERERPVTQARAGIVPVTSAHGILMVEKHALLFQRPKSGLWGGMWEFPGLDSVPDAQTARNAKGVDSKAAALLRTFAALGIETEILAPLGTVSHSYTNHRLTAHFYRLASPAGLTMAALSEKLGDVPHRFVRWDKTGELAMPAHHRKMAERYFSGRKHSIAEQCTL